MDKSSYYICDLYGFLLFLSYDFVIKTIIWDAVNNIPSTPKIIKNNPPKYR